MMLDSLYWREPLWLWLILLPVALLLLGQYRQQQFWLRLADPELLPWIQSKSENSSYNLPKVLLIVSWLLFSVALSGPRTPLYIPPDVRPEKETAIIIVDFSSSMQAIDAAINNKTTSRIIAAKYLLQHWSKEMPETLQVGIIIFAGHAHWLLKPTDDFHLIKHHLNQFDQLIPPTLGNELAGALRLAEAELHNSQQTTHLVLLTDGDFDETHREKAELTFIGLREKHNNLHLNIIGIGGIESARIPTNRNKPLMVDNRPATTRLESQWLHLIARNTKSQYLKIDTASKQSFTTLLQLKQPRILPENLTDVLWHELFSIPLSIGIILLLAALQLQKSGLKK